MDCLQEQGLPLYIRNVTQITHKCLEGQAASWEVWFQQEETICSSSLCLPPQNMSDDPCLLWHGEVPLSVSAKGLVPSLCYSKEGQNPEDVDSSAQPSRHRSCVLEADVRIPALFSSFPFGFLAAKRGVVSLCHMVPQTLHSLTTNPK